MSGNPEKKKVDILNREDFIDRTVRLVNMISSNKGNITFAINGEWGCGKTFVLEEIEKRLSEDESKKYLVIPYNCWQYDYYDEPLVAIVSAMLSFLKQTKRVSAKRKEKLISKAKAVGKTALSICGQVIEHNTGIKGEQIVDSFNDLADDFERVDQQEQAFDSYLNLRDMLNSLKKELKKLTEKKTIVFCVDELDRCLPEYATKVLERLHHITEELPNTITIIAIDKTRLVKTISNIFGEDNASSYLKKFIRFEIELDKGKQNGKKFFDKFPEFYNRFDALLYGGLNNTEQFIEELFDGIDPRTQEQIVEKATIFNDICFGNEKQDHTMMYMELFLATLHYHYHEGSIFSNNKIIADRNDVFSNCISMPNAFRDHKTGFVIRSSIYTDFNDYCFFIDEKDIFMVVLFYWYHVPEHSGSRPINTYVPKKMGEGRLCDNTIKLRNNIELLRIID